MVAPVFYDKNVSVLPPTVIDTAASGNTILMAGVVGKTTQLYRIILSQSLTVGALGFLVGTPLAIGASRLIEHFVPEFGTLFEWRPIAAVLVGVLAVSLVAAYLPVRRIAAIDPALVFRA